MGLSCPVGDFGPLGHISPHLSFSLKDLVPRETLVILEQWHREEKLHDLYIPWAAEPAAASERVKNETRMFSSLVVLILCFLHCLSSNPTSM